MFEDIRISYGISRNQLATLTGRSINYLLKAEQCTFPTPPVALLAFYTQPDPPQNTPLLTSWEAYDKDILCEAYYDKQRRKRQEWLDRWLPVTNFNTKYWSLRQKWLPAEDARTGQAHGLGAGAVGHFGALSGVYPNSYQLSVGLCIPASVVYRNDKDPNTQSNAIRAAMGDLVEYVESGRFLAANYSSEDVQRIELGVLRIAEEEGWKKLADSLPAELRQQQAS